MRRKHPGRPNRSLLALVPIAVVGAAALLGWYVTHRKPSPATPQSAIRSPQPALPNGLGDTFNILLTGRDARLLGDKSQDGRRRNAREKDYHSDVIIIAHINLTLPRVTLVSIPRDMLVVIPGYSRAESRTDFPHLDKITHVTAYRGDPLLIKTIEKLLGIRIPRRMALDFDSFRLGFALLKPFLGKVSVGNRTLTTPDSALMFVRDRRHFPNDDIDRSRNSLRFVKLTLTRLWSRLDNKFLGRLLPQVLSLLGNDTDLTAGELQAIITRLRQRRFVPDSIATAVLIGVPGPVTLESYGQTLSCYIPAYNEIERQANYYLKDKLDAPAPSFMEQNQKIRYPGYCFENYDFMPDTSRIDTLNPTWRRLPATGQESLRNAGSARLRDSLAREQRGDTLDSVKAKPDSTKRAGEPKPKPDRAQPGKG